MVFEAIDEASKNYRAIMYHGFHPMRKRLPTTSIVKDKPYHLGAGNARIGALAACPAADVFNRAGQRVGIRCP